MAKSSTRRKAELYREAGHPLVSQNRNPNAARDARKGHVMSMQNTPSRQGTAGTHDFLFLAHPVENVSAPLMWSRRLNQRPIYRWWWLWLLWPVWVVVSLIFLFGRKAYKRVENYRFNGNLRGHTWLVRAFAWQFLPKALRPRIRARIRQAVLDAQAMGIEVVGLGALTKAEWVNHGGRDLVDDLGDQLHIPLVHGDTLTAWAVYEEAKQLIRERNLGGKPVFVTGATSKIGRAIVLAFAENGVRVVMFTKSRERYLQIRGESINPDMISQATTLEAGRECGLWITGKAVPRGKVLVKYLPHGATVLNFSVPDPFTPSALRHRPDVCHRDGGLLAFDATRCNAWCTMRLKPGLVYACHAGTIVHAKVGLDRGWGHEVGPVDMARLWEVGEAARDIGFFLPPAMSFGRILSERRRTLAEWWDETTRRWNRLL